jgi:formylglycine-generating enzyme required for sulfatase activity
MTDDRRLTRSAEALCIALFLVAGCGDGPPARWSDPSTGMELVLLQAGEFRMGSPADEPGHQPDEILHRVRLTKRFYMGVHEVTRRQWAALMPGRTPVAEAPDLPVVNVNWPEIQEFVGRMGRGRAGRFRLPTEAEWEYACRAGTSAAYSTGAYLSTDEANYNGRFPLPGQPAGIDRGALTPVGSFKPNAWGLHDMHGNAWEWTDDAKCAYSEGDVVDPRAACDDPSAAASGSSRAPSRDEPLKVIRGGSWRFNADSARCALRYTHRPQDRGDSLGFRVVREVF